MWLQMGVEKVVCDFVSCCDVTNILRSIYWFVLQWSWYVFVHDWWNRRYWQRWHWCLMIMAMGGGWIDDAWVTNVDVWHGTWCTQSWMICTMISVHRTYVWLIDCWCKADICVIILWKWMIEWCLIRMSVVWHWCRSATYVIVGVAKIWVRVKREAGSVKRL